MSQEQEHEWSIDRRRCLIRELLRLTNERGTGWLKEYVHKWRMWEGVREDFWRQWRASNRGEPGDWRE
jgi:hypothetical protein